ncbi:hypothetical protein GCM10010140_46780 [Streptosporangium pseudovulgare]|uniref:DUF3761 domain-containing protein n=1 Tax=Streptosporangium pseudovulgare TaxID=35765 RepID=A0ABQ2R366_9ACTN|nr:hypothetical protein GCM10010140_46780 [Streptosporangium pseudovulgare]
MAASAFLAGSLLAVPAAVIPTSAATAQAAVSAGSHAACQYRQDGRVWRCITPGAFCPAAAHSRYGYAKVSGRKYKCTFTRGDIRWRWKPVR